MVDFSERSLEKEKLDEDNIPETLLFQNLRELNTINRLLGGHLTSRVGIVHLIKAHNLKNKKVVVLDIACGGGDNIMQLHSWARRKGLDMYFIGLDYKPDAIRFAENHCSGLSNVQWVCASYEQIPELNLEYDIALTALFCHHLTDEQIRLLVKAATQNAKIGLVINDLHRHWLAYYGIKWLTKLFSRSPLVKHDAPLSVRRGFVRSDWSRILKGIVLELKWIWAFRWCVIVSKKQIVGFLETHEGCKGLGAER